MIFTVLKAMVHSDLGNGYYVNTRTYRLCSTVVQVTKYSESVSDSMNIYQFPTGLRKAGKVLIVRSERMDV